MHADGATLCKCDRLDFNYHNFEPGQDCTIVSWMYVGQMCSPISFTMQAFRLGAVTSRQLSSPRLALDSASTTFSFPTNELTTADEVIYFRVLAMNAEGAICNPNGLYEFYNFTVLIPNGMQ